MSTSAHIAARNAIVALLQAAPALAGGHIAGKQQRPMDAEIASQIWVYLQDSPAKSEVIGQTEWRTTICVHCVARDQSGTSAETSADQLCVAAHERIMADPTLSGVAIDTVPLGWSWPDDEIDPSVTSCRLLFSVWQITPDTSVAA